MQLTNHSRYPADIFRTVMDQERIAAAVFARITFDIVDGELRHSDEQPWIVSGPPWDSPQGPMDSDEVFYKGGVDLFLFGRARAPQDHAVTQMRVRIAVGAWTREVDVFGNRVWERHGKRIAASAPAPFREMPLTIAHAYGGADEWDALVVAYPANPDGKGYYIDEEKAIGGPLPNLEELDAPITAWTDQPDPAGLGPCAMQSPLRMRNGVGFDDEGAIVQIRPTLFNAAFPRMIVPSVAPGETVTVEGVLPDRPLSFRLPDASPRLRLTFGAEVIEPTLTIDQIGIEADESRVFVAYRYPFRYVIHPLQLRTCELFGGEPATSGGRAQ